MLKIRKFLVKANKEEFVTLEYVLKLLDLDYLCLSSLSIVSCFSFALGYTQKSTFSQQFWCGLVENSPNKCPRVKSKQFL